MSSVRATYIDQKTGTGTSTTAITGARPKGSVLVAVLLVANGVPANHTLPPGWQVIVQQGFDTIATPTDTLYVLAKLGENNGSTDGFQASFAASYVYAVTLFQFDGCRAADKNGASLAEHVASAVLANDTAAQTFNQAVIVQGTLQTAGFADGSGTKNFLLAAGLNGGSATTGIGSLFGYHPNTAQENPAAGRTIIGSADQGTPYAFSGNVFNQAAMTWTATNRRYAGAVIGLQDAPSLSLAGMGC